MKTWYLYLAVIVSGASVLAIEILGTRIIGPFYGVSLFLWSALITVTLAALSVGYALGGHWADRGPRLSRLGTLLALAGLWLGAIPWITRPVFVVAEPFGLRFAVLVAAFVLFFPPLTLLGMVSPYAIRLKASTLDVVGRTAGNLYAISTAASVVAALATGFFLIPNVGVSRLTFLIGVILIAMGPLGYAAAHSTRALSLTTLLLLPFAVAAALLAPTQKADPDRGLLAIEQSAYAEIRVLQNNDQSGRSIRYLIIDGGIHTIVDPRTWASYAAYVDVMDLTKALFRQPGRLLLIGLGGGSVVKRFAADRWEVDAVEIDPVITKVAYQFFGLKPSEAEIFHMDGRQFLITHDDRYDLIFMDAWGSSAIPFHLITGESFGLIASRLKADGKFAINVSSAGWQDVLVRSVAASLKQHFREVQVLPMDSASGTYRNLIILASNRDFELLEEVPNPGRRFGRDYNQAYAWANRFEPDTRGAPVLTDELNPVDLWAERINLLGREDLHDYFGPEGLSW